MAVSEQTPVNSSTGNGVTTVFPYTFKILAAADLEVTVDGVVKTLNTDYTLSGVGDDGGGDVTFLAAPANDTTVIRRRNMAYVRTTDYQYQGELPNDVLNQDQDAPVLMIQQLGEGLGRAFKVPAGDEALSDLPTAADRANLYPVFDANGDLTVSSGTGADAGLRADLADDTGGGLVGFLQSGAGAVARTVNDKMRDTVSIKDTGAVVGSDAGAAVAAAIAAHSHVKVPAGAFTNTSTALAVPFNKALEFGAGASLASSGSGSLTSQGTIVRWAYNPDSATWTDYIGKANRTGVHVDLGNYGPTSFSTLASHAAVVGSVNVPSGALTGGWGIAGYAKTVAAGGPAVAVYGEANVAAAGVTAWGINTRTIDHGYLPAQVWGAEIDVDLDNPNTVAVGVDVVGGSTVEPAVTIAYRVGALGAFASPKKRWQRGFFSDDGCAVTALEVGNTADSGSNVGSQPITFFYRNGGGTRTKGAALYVDIGGAFIVDQDGGTFMKFRGRSAGTGFDVFQIAGNAIGFFGTAPQAKKTITGSKGGNVALDSLLQELAAYGLITNSTT